MGMMRRRVSAVLAAAVLAVRLLAPDVGHACESSLTPGPGAAVSHAHGSSASLISEAPSDRGLEAAHAHEHAHETAHSEPASEAPHECDCDTTCCCVAGAVSVLQGASHVTARYIAVTRADIAHRVSREPTWVDHVLPFTTPPPSATLS
jgi:hypothetical protein